MKLYALMHRVYKLNFHQTAGPLFAPSKISKNGFARCFYSTLKNITAWKKCFVLCPAVTPYLMVRTLVNNTQHRTRWPFVFVIPTRPFPDNFEAKDKKRKMYPGGLWNSCVGPQKQHFITGAIQKGDQQYMGEFKWEALCVGKSQRDLSRLWPLGPFLHPLMSDFDVYMMIEKQSTVVQFNSSGEWVS